MVIRKTLHACGIVALACFAWNPGAFANGLGHEGIAGDLKRLVEQSNLVIVGEVASVKYVNLRVEGEGELPHTIVTYRVQDTLRGISIDGFLSLRFIGGTDGRGGFMAVTGVPQFQEGERDILFVAGNGGDQLCPLVNCQWGRYRLHQNRVFNTHGQPVRGIVNDVAIARGERAKPFETFTYPTPSFGELMENPEALATLDQLNISIEEARRRYQAMAPRQIVLTLGDLPRAPIQDRGVSDPWAENRGSGGRPDTMIGAQPISAGIFVAKVRQLDGQALRRPAVVWSINPDAPVVIGRRPPPAAPAMPEQARAPRQLTPEDQEEVRRMRSQDFNPVLN